VVFARLGTIEKPVTRSPTMGEEIRQDLKRKPAQISIQSMDSTKREAPNQNQHRALDKKKARPTSSDELSFCMEHETRFALADGLTDSTRWSIAAPPSVGNVLRSLNSLMFARFTLRRGA
jgi:hypothetical protein